MSTSTSDSAQQQSFGKRFKLWRQAQGITAYRLAKLTGVHPSFISNIEADRRPMSDSFMGKLAQIDELGIQYETLQAWKAESEYGVHVLQKAVNTASPSVPVRWVIQGNQMQSRSEQATYATLPWNLTATPPENIEGIEVASDILMPFIPQHAFLLVHQTQQLIDGKQYLVVLSNQAPFLAEKNHKKLVPLDDTKPAVDIQQVASAQVFQILSYTVDWSQFSS